MKITKEEILHVAHLARLEIDEGAVGKFAAQIGDAGLQDEKKLFDFNPLAFVARPIPY